MVTWVCGSVPRPVLNCNTTWYNPTVPGIKEAESTWLVLESLKEETDA